MAAAATEYYGKLLCALIELQQLHAELLGQLSVQHVKGNSADPNTALANVLADQEATVRNLKSMAYTCNETKIYVSKNPPVLRNPLDIQVLDTTLQHDFLLWLEGFPVSKPSNASRNKKVNCTGACARSYKRKDICCDHCMQCNDCNKRLPATHQCPTFKLKLGLEKDKLLRNLVSHLTLKTLENFINGTNLNNQPSFPDFPHVNNWQDLSQEFVNTMTCISDYMGDATNFNNPNVKLLQQHEKTKKLDKLHTILDKDMKTECDLNLLTNLKQIIKEQHQKQIDEHKKQIDEVEKVVADLEEFREQLPDEEISNFSHSKIEEVAVIEDEEQRIIHDRTWTFVELNNLLINESTRDQFNAIIESNPSLTKLRDNINDTLLHRAAVYGATECVEVLINNRCDVKEKDGDGLMAIHFAALFNNTQVMKILLSHDPLLVNVTTNNNNTPLHGAALNNHREAVELLLSQPSVDVNLRDRWGKTPDEWASDDQIKTMIRSHHNYSPQSTTDA